MAKFKRLSQNGNLPNETKILETIHSDFIGLINIYIISSTGKGFQLIFINELSRKSWIYFLEERKDLIKAITQFLKNMYNYSLQWIMATSIFFQNT